MKESFPLFLTLLPFYYMTHIQIPLIKLEELDVADDDDNDEADERGYAPH